MPEATSVTLTDRATSPVDHEYFRNGGTNGVALFTTREGVLSGTERLSVSVRRSGRSKVDIRLSRPVTGTATIDGVQRSVVTRVNRAQVVLDFAPDSTLQERKDLVGMLEDLLGTDQTEMTTVMTQVEEFY